MILGRSFGEAKDAIGVDPAGHRTQECLVARLPRPGPVACLFNNYVIEKAVIKAIMFADEDSQQRT